MDDSDIIDLASNDDNSDNDQVDNRRRLIERQPNSNVKTQKSSYHTFGQSPSVTIVNNILNISRLSEKNVEKKGLI